MVPDRRFPNRGSGGKTEKLDMADYKNINIRNKRATFDYEIIEEWIAGIVLVGTEIKSVRLGKASITDSYCYFDKGELWIRGVNIAEYGWGTCNNHVPRRDRKLLLNRKELNKIQRALQDRGLTVVGLRLFLNERGLAKVVVGLARGRKAYDKREYLKENDAKREEFWANVEIGKQYTGVVKSLTNYGAFVDIGGVDGMVHISCRCLLSGGIGSYGYSKRFAGSGFPAAAFRIGETVRIPRGGLRRSFRFPFASGRGRQCRCEGLPEVFGLKNERKKICHLFYVSKPARTSVRSVWPGTGS